MLDELGRGGRLASTLEILGAGEQVPRALAHAASDQRRVLELAGPQRDVEALGHQVDPTLGQLHLELDLGVARAELGHDPTHALVPVDGAVTRRCPRGSPWSSETERAASASCCTAPVTSAW